MSKICHKIPDRSNRSNLSKIYQENGRFLAEWSGFAWQGLAKVLKHKKTKFDRLTIGGPKRLSDVCPILKPSFTIKLASSTVISKYK